MASLETTTAIANRYDGLELWYSENTEENPKAGQLYTITAKFEELDSAKLSDCREYFIGMLETAKNTRKDAVTSAYYKGRLENSYTIYSGMMNNQYGATTTTIIMSYENVITALDNIMLEAISAYKTDAINSFTTIYNDYKTAYPTYEASLTTTYNKYLAILSKDNYEYTQGEDTIKEAWTEAKINKIFADGKAELDEIIALPGYIEEKLTALEAVYTEYKTNYPELEAGFTNAYNAGANLIPQQTSKDDVDTIYEAAEYAIQYVYLNEYKTGKLTELANLRNSYSVTYPNLAESYSNVYSKYDTIMYDRVYTYIENEQEVTVYWTTDYIDSVYNTAVTEFANVYKNSLLAEFELKYADFQVIYTSDELENTYNEAVSNINDASSNDDAKEIFDNALLELAKISYSGALDDAYDAYYTYFGNNHEEKQADLGVIYANAQTQIPNATTIEQVQAIYGNAINAMDDLLVS